MNNPPLQLMMAIPRLTGYYWIKLKWDDTWIIGIFYTQTWAIHNCTDYFIDADIVEIGPMIEQYMSNVPGK